MRLEKIDLNLFVVFDALYQEGSVTKVAQRLNLTQPAVSNALSRLRQTFDDQLFVRTPSGMAPTPVAESVVGDVRKALGLLGRSVGAAASFDPFKAEKQFCIGMNDLAQSLLLAPLREQLKRRAPRSSLHIYYVDRQVAAEDLKAGNLDLLLDAPDLVNARELEQQGLASLPYALAGGSGSPVDSGEITLDGYLASEHLHVSSRRKGRGQVDVALHTMGKKRDIKVRVQSYLVAAQLARETDLLWTVPEVFARTTGLAVADLPFAVEPLGWTLFWHRSAADDPANQWLRNLVGEVATALF